MNQGYWNFKFNSLPTTLFPKSIYHSFDSYYSQQETAQGSLESPHPANFTCPGMELRALAVSQGTWVQNILQEKSEIWRGKALTFEKQAASFGKMTLVRCFLHSLFLRNAGNVSWGPRTWITQWGAESRGWHGSSSKSGSSHIIVVISWWCFQMTVFFRCHPAEECASKVDYQTCSLWPPRWEKDILRVKGYNLAME